MAEKNDTTKSQHYVQQAYQDGFFEDGKTNFWIFDKNLLVRPNGEIEKNFIVERGTRVCFENDFFYTSGYYKEKDFLEKSFFGPIDSSGAVALKYMLSENKYILPCENVGMMLLKYISAQKFRTPKGLALIRESIPGNLTRESLLESLQEAHENMTITLSESVIEILDASNCKAKFIVSDSPVVEYNRYISKSDVDLYLAKGTQVIFPVGRNFCLVSTPRELADNSLSKKDYLKPRINARKYGKTIFDIRKLQNLRCVNDDEVCRINILIKNYASRYVAGGKKEDLFPLSNSDLGLVIMPKSFKRSAGIAREVSGNVVGVDEYGKPLMGKNLEDFKKFFNWANKYFKK